MDRPSRFPLYLGVLLVIAGWVALLVGWYQAGRQDLETGQIPYVLSGGFGGWALLVMGAAAVVVDVMRQAEWRAHEQLDEVRAALDGVAELLERALRRAPERRAEEAAPERSRARDRSGRRRGGRGESGSRPGDQSS